MKTYFLFIIALTFTSLTWAQDAFYSNYMYSNALSNPSGMAVNEDINMTLLHRSQWTSIVKPFSTSQFEGSFPIRQANSNKKVAVIGMSFINDRLGESGNLTTNQFAVSGAYLLSLGKSNLALGAKLGYFNGATDISSIQTGSQFVNGSYQSSVNIGENLQNPVVTGLEVTPSFTFFQNDEDGINRYSVGVSAFNVNQPNSANLIEGFGHPMRIAINAGYTHKMNAIGIRPQTLIMLQGNQTHVVAGADINYYFQQNGTKYQGIALGGYYRMNDAGIVSLKYISSTIHTGISYDINTSGLADPLSRKTGSFELFLNYRIQQTEKVKQFDHSIRVFDADTKTPIVGTAAVMDNGIKKELLFTNQSEGSHQLNQKTDYIIQVESEGYTSYEIQITNASNEKRISDVYLQKTVKYFDLELSLVDKRTNEAVQAQIYLINSATGEETLLGTSNTWTQSLAVGKNHKIVARADGYDIGELNVTYDKVGAVSKTLFLDKTVIATQLKLIVLDENTKQPITITAMAICTQGPNKDQSALLAMNSLPPAKYPLNVGNVYEILITKEGYFNKTIKLEALKIEDIEKVVLLTPIEVGASVIVEDLLFKTGKTELDERSFRILDQLVDFMKQNPTIKIELQGHTDSDGSASANQKLSEGRAKSAMDYMVNKGISPARMTAKGYGQTQPIDTNATPEGKAKNRRVELKITGK
jgi:type IX secretion system PorP/SprF family membrane protein